MAKLSIDIVSDTVCPWCWVGKRKLERTLAIRPDLRPEIRWRAYRLNPDVPKEGMDRDVYTAKKFGSVERARAIYKRIEQAGAEEGLSFRFDRIRRAIDTTDSHRLIHWAHGAGVQDAMVEALFTAYFIEGRDISDLVELVQIAQAVGMDPAIVADLLASRQDCEAVERDVEAAAAMKVQGVPCFIFNRTIGVSGAQDPDILLQAIDDALARSSAEA